MKTIDLKRTVLLLFLCATSVFGAIKAIESNREVKSSLLLDQVEAEANPIESFLDWWHRPDWVKMTSTCHMQNPVIGIETPIIGITIGGGTTYDGETHYYVKVANGTGTHAHQGSTCVCHLPMSKSCCTE